jgi:hypothetical protein
VRSAIVVRLDPNGGMKMAKKIVPISIEAIAQRINQKLAAKGQILMATRHGCAE